MSNQVKLLPETEASYQNCHVPSGYETSKNEQRVQFQGERINKKQFSLLLGSRPPLLQTNLRNSLHGWYNQNREDMFCYIRWRH